MRFLAVVEVLGALGLILPLAMGFAPVLTIVTPVCLGIVMVGATVIHIKHKENKMTAFTFILLVVLIFIVIGHLVWVPIV